MFRIQLAVATSVFESDIRTALHRAMQVGAQGVQFDLRNEVTARDYGETARRQLLHYLQERSLQTASATFPLRSALGSADHFEERLNGIRAAMELAAQLKIRLLSIRPGPIPPADAAAEHELLHAALTDLAAQGNRVGVALLLVSPDAPAAEVLSLLSSVKSGPVGIDADLADWILQGRKPMAQLRELHNVVQHMEARDGIRDHDRFGHETALGRGQVDWDEFAGLLSEMEYQGWITLQRSEGRDRVGDVERGLQYLRRLLLLDAQ